MRRFDESNAECLVLTYREGLLSPLGHDLKIRVTRFVIDVDEAERAVDARLDAGSLRVVCAMRDGVEAPETLRPADRAEIEDNIVRHVLDATRHPEIRFVSRSVEEEKDIILVDGTLAIRGRERRLIVPLRKKARGWVAEVRVHQPDFGIPPFRALLGALRVKADVTVRLSLPAA
jgi:YceI-like domain